MTTAIDLACTSGVSPPTARPYQTRLVNQIVGAFRAGQKEVLLAACPNAGKTFMSMETVEALIASGNVRRVLVLAHGTKVLRNQYRDRLLSDRPELAGVMDVRIPQELHRKKVARYDLVIVDEAHQFYGPDCEMNERILAQAKPKYILLLTGSPAKFIADGFEAGRNMFCYSLQQLHADEPKAVADVMIECAVSNYKWTDQDLVDTWGDLKPSVVATQRQTNATLDQVLKTLKTRLDLSGERLDGMLGRFRFKSVRDGWNKTLARMKKTILATPSIEVAEQVGAYFENLGVKCVVSHSEDDVESENIETFKSDAAVRLLVVVNRAQLGFDFSELFNFVDMTGSRNPDRIFQMFCRVVRSSKDNPRHNKLFVKVMPGSFPQLHVRAFMSGVLSLAQQENFETWNGRGFGLTEVPVERPRRRGGNKIDPKPPAEPKVPFLKPGMMVFGDYFKALEHNPDDALAVYAMVKLGEVVGMKVDDPAGNKKKIVAFFKINGRWPAQHTNETEIRLASLMNFYVSKTQNSYDPVFESDVRALGWLPRSDKTRRVRAFLFAWPSKHDGLPPSRGSKDPTLYEGLTEALWGSRLHVLKKTDSSFRKEWKALNVKSGHARRAPL